MVIIYLKKEVPVGDRYDHLNLRIIIGSVIYFVQTLKLMCILKENTNNFTIQNCRAWT